MVAPRSRASAAPSWARMRFNASTRGPICAATSSSSACTSSSLKRISPVNTPGRRKMTFRSGCCWRPFSCRGGAEGGDIALQQIRVKLSAGAKAAIDRQGNFQVAAQHFFLEQPAQAHLQRLGAGRHAHVQVEKTVVDALETRDSRQRDR